MAPDLTLDGKPRKFRIRFRKTGDLRLVSHHDLMHVFERMFRRADLAIPVSQGFNPRPRMWFALSLALGVAGLNEVLEIEVANPLDVAELRERLARQCPVGIDIVSVREIDGRASARVRRAWYRAAIPGDAIDLPARCDAFLALSEHWVERTRPHPRRINVRPYVDELRCHADHLAMALWITPYGAARPEEIIAALGLQGMLDDGVVVERTDLEICDEMPAGTPEAPVIARALQETDTNQQRRDETRVPHRPTAIVDNPLSFDT